MDGDPGREDERRDALNELTQLLTQTAKPYVESGSDILHVRLGGTQMRMGDANGPRGQMDWSDDQTDELRGQTYVLNQSNNTEMAGISHGDGAGTYLGAGDAKREPDEPDGCGNLADMLSAHTDAHSDGDESETSANVRINVRMGRIDSKPRNSPEICKIATAKPIGQWRGVSTSCTDVHVPLSVPIDTASQNFVFGRLESGDEAIAPSLEGKRVVKGDGNQSGGDGDGDDTESGGSVDSQRVEGARLSTESQYTCQ